MNDIYRAHISYTTRDGWEWSELEQFKAATVADAEARAIALAEETIKNPFEPTNRRPSRAWIRLSSIAAGELADIDVDGDDVTICEA